jgi:hypothetical protein
LYALLGTNQSHASLSLWFLALEQLTRQQRSTQTPTMLNNANLSPAKTHIMTQQLLQACGTKLFHAYRQVQLYIQQASADETDTMAVM